MCCKIFGTTQASFGKRDIKYYFVEVSAIKGIKNEKKSKRFEIQFQSRAIGGLLELFENNMFQEVMAINQLII